ncbi:MAG: arabinogalactan oligomer / maltooligosaccharide transport system permease protein, partial [Solirubrobacteraceae bacterium]|nr:arabinogalactan oligomer / maltooligosaccharide transport system permease protein [Solirubrobacteraceae bacterium]
MTTPVAVVPRIEIRPAARTRTGGGRRLKLGNQILLQFACLAIGSTVLFPIVWIVGMSLDPRNISRPDSLIPPGANLDAYARVLERPTLNPVSFFQLALNSLTLAVIISVLSVGLGVLAAYSFSRMKFRGREFTMLLILAVLMLPAVATVG